MSPGTPTAAAAENPRGLSVIAPCFNEQANIDALVDRMLPVFDSLDVPAELLLIDDGSTDQTWQRIQRRVNDDLRVRGVQHPYNQGMAKAWRTGLANATGRLVCLIDADLQNRPEDIAVLYDAYLGGTCDIVQAVRRPAQGVRRILLFSRGLNFLLNTTFGMCARDNKSGFVLCHREVLADILHHRFRYRYFQSFLGCCAWARGYTIGEVDTVFEQRQRGESFLSRLPLLVSARILCELLKFRIETLLPEPQTAGDLRSEWSGPPVLTETSASEL